MTRRAQVLAALTRDVRELQRATDATDDALARKATQGELKQTLDAAHLASASAVAAAMAPLQAHTQREIEALRRHVAALRVQGSPASMGTMSEEEVEGALSAQQPSEVLVQGVVAGAVHRLEGELEARRRPLAEALLTPLSGEVPTNLPWHPRAARERRGARTIFSSSFSRASPVWVVWRHSGSGRPT